VLRRAGRYSGLSISEEAVDGLLPFSAERVSALQTARPDEQQPARRADWLPRRRLNCGTIFAWGRREIHEKRRLTPWPYVRESRREAIGRLLPGKLRSAVKGCHTKSTPRFRPNSGFLFALADPTPCSELMQRNPASKVVQVLRLRESVITGRAVYPGHTEEQSLRRHREMGVPPAAFEPDLQSHPRGERLVPAKAGVK